MIRSPHNSWPCSIAPKGGVLGRSAAYPRTATSTPALQHLLGAVREWNILWAYGTSGTWTRERIDAELNEATVNAAIYIDLGV